MVCITLSCEIVDFCCIKASVCLVLDKINLDD